MQTAVRNRIKNHNPRFCTKPRLKAPGLEEQVIFPRSVADGSVGALLAAGKPFSSARLPPPKQISKRSMETTTNLVPGGGFMSACRGDEEQQELAAMGGEN